MFKKVNEWLSKSILAKGRHNALSEVKLAAWDGDSSLSKPFQLQSMSTVLEHVCCFVGCGWLSVTWGAYVDTGLYVPRLDRGSGCVCHDVGRGWTAQLSKCVAAKRLMDPWAQQHRTNPAQKPTSRCIQRSIIRVHQCMYTVQAFDDMIRRDLLRTPLHTVTHVT